ncbi:calcium-binding protein [Rhizobium alvei]|uniref:Calcium-binding protein n=1 Tax=Rhizobium alvei TaxID=1132659 RepID=A0ABT8YJB8_9HYPH|nr:calcium-binding protein [Rhizobium alvei]MDO6963738.1 calcium-binding protein [Rhizobium alvei]
MQGGWNDWKHDRDDDDRDHYDDDHHHHHDDDEDENEDFDFSFDVPDTFKIDLENLDLTSFGKISDFEAGRKHLSVTFGNNWTFAIDGSGFDIALKSNGLPIIKGGTVDSFSIDGPGKADWSISDLDMSLKAFVKALVSFDTEAVLDLVLGGDETISGSGFGDYLFAGKGDDTLLGNAGADKLMGGVGDDTISGGKGNDFLLGGKGSDTFTFEAKSGLDVIDDFDAWSDVIDLSALGLDIDIEDFLDANIMTEGGRGHHGEHRCGGGGDRGDVIVVLSDGNALKLDGVERWEITEDNFIL